MGRCQDVGVGRGELWKKNVGLQGGGGGRGRGGRGIFSMFRFLLITINKFQSKP